MKSRLLRKITKSQKYQILTEIKRSQGLSVSELCDRMNLSYMGVKQHCVALEKDGYLDTWRRPKGMGRPEKAYRLTELAQEFFPTEYTNFTLEILNSITQVYGEAAPEKILYQIYQNQNAEVRMKVTGTNLEEKARSLAALRESEGYMSEYYFNPDTQQHQIIEYNSPVLAIADRYKIMHRLEQTMFETVLSVPVSRNAERISGLYKCVFTCLT
ncbi:MAG: helix-turn-helix transcriptional regulator [Candidatus Methylacidiphilales bacterium]|nr:winged helix-turn-helix transcriptional regulator [Candidatus Methylacidiphilales bacterium]